MPLDSNTAAQVAYRHGLDLADAVALQRLADSEEEAEAIAKNFAPDDDPRQFVRNLFERAEQARRPRRAVAQIPDTVYEPKDDK